MENIFKYLDDTQYDSIYDRPFNELDLLILTELAYLSFDGLVTRDLELDKSKRLQDIAENYPQEQSMMHTRNRLKLLEKASQTKRFKNIKLMGFINDIDLEIEKQFAALVYCIQSKPATYVLAYRGTDDSIIGWKEDFHMTYMDRVPAQKNAKKYLKEVLRELDGDFILTGHSKEGTWLLMLLVKLILSCRRVLKRSIVMMLLALTRPSLKAMVIKRLLIKSSITFHKVLLWA